MNISVIAVGKIKEKYFTDAIQEYSKRLSRYCKLQIIEVPDEKAPDNISAADEDKIRRLEGERILGKIKDGTYVILLDLRGRQLDSVEFGTMLEKQGLAGRSDIAFIIGGSLGVTDQVFSKADDKLSFSRMTFPHQMMRVFLLEQIYRGFKINKGEVYHK